MKKQVIKSLLFGCFLVSLAYLNMVVFRSEFPMLWLVTLLASVVLLILFPYSKYFQTKKS